MMLGGANANLSVESKLKEVLGPDAMTPPRAVKVDVDAAGEGLVFGGAVPEEVTEPVAVFEAVSGLLEDAVPCLVLLALQGLCESKPSDYAMIAWTPDASPVKLRMLCASSRRTIREEFSNLHFKEYNATERREVTWEQYQESTRARTEQDRFAAMTQDEIDQLEVRKQVAKEQAMAPKKLAGLAALQVKVNESFESSMKRLLESSEVPSAVIATLASEELHGDLLELSSSGPSALKGKLPSEPCFALMRGKGDQLLFMTWLPDGATVKQKMKTSTFKASVLDHVKSCTDLELILVEASEDDDLDDSLLESGKAAEASPAPAPMVEAMRSPVTGPKPPAGAVALPGLSPTKPKAEGYSETAAPTSPAKEAPKEVPLFAEKETTGKMAFGGNAGTSPEAADTTITETLSLAELQDASVWKGRNVIATERERYLPDDVFQSLFGMEKEAFAKLPKWKRDNKKKEHGLF